MDEKRAIQDAISIHSLHTEGDRCCKIGGIFHPISIHSLHTEGDEIGR